MNYHFLIKKPLGGFTMKENTTTEKTGTKVAELYFQLLQENKWEEVVKLYDPEALKHFKSMMSGEENQSAEEFFASYLQQMMDFASVIGDVNFNKVNIIGSIPEGDMLHIMVRTVASVGEMSIEKMEVLSLKKHGDGWKIILSGKMEGMLQKLELEQQDLRPNLYLVK